MASFLEEILTRRESRCRFILGLCCFIVMFIIFILQIAFLAKDDGLTLYRENHIWEEGQTDKLIPINVEYPSFTVCPSRGENGVATIIQKIKCEFNTDIALTSVKRLMFISGAEYECYDVQTKNLASSRENSISCQITVDSNVLVHFWAPNVIIHSPSRDIFDWTVVFANEQTSIGLQRVDYNEPNAASSRIVQYQAAKVIPLYGFSNTDFSVSFSIQFVDIQVKVFDEYGYRPQWPWTFWVGVVGGDIMLGILLFQLFWHFILPKIFNVEKERSPPLLQKTYDTLQFSNNEDLSVFSFMLLCYDHLSFVT